MLGRKRRVRELGIWQKFRSRYSIGVVTSPSWLIGIGIPSLENLSWERRYHGRCPYVHIIYMLFNCRQKLEGEEKKSAVNTQPGSGSDEENCDEHLGGWFVEFLILERLPVVNCCLDDAIHREGPQHGKHEKMKKAVYEDLIRNSGCGGAAGGAPWSERCSDKIWPKWFGWKSRNLGVLGFSGVLYTRHLRAITSSMQGFKRPDLRMIRSAHGAIERKGSWPNLQSHWRAVSQCCIRLFQLK